MHKESLFSDLPFDQPRFEHICHFIKDAPGFHGGLDVEYDREPAAFACHIYRLFRGSRQSWMTVMHTLYIRSTPIGGYIWSRILPVVRGWSVPRGSRGIMFNLMWGIAIEETDTVLRASGGTHLGGNDIVRI